MFCFLVCFLLVQFLWFHSWDDRVCGCQDVRSKNSLLSVISQPCTHFWTFFREKLFHMYGGTDRKERIKKKNRDFWKIVNWNRKHSLISDLGATQERMWCFTGETGVKWHKQTREVKKKKKRSENVKTEDQPVGNLVRKEYRQRRKRWGLETSIAASRKDLVI